MRGIMANRSSGWRALTQAQRDDWDTWAALPAQELTNSLGEAYYISGFLWFAKLNNRLEFIGRSTITTKPTGSRPAASTLHIWVYNDPASVFTVQLKWESITSTSNDGVVFAQAIPASGRTVQYGHFPWYTYVKPLSSDPKYFSTAGNHEGLWGEATDGWTLFTRGYEQTSEGLRGPATTDRETFPK